MYRRPSTAMNTMKRAYESDMATIAAATSIFVLTRKAANPAASKGIGGGPPSPYQTSATYGRSARGMNFALRMNVRTQNTAIAPVTPATTKRTGNEKRPADRTSTRKPMPANSENAAAR